MIVQCEYCNNMINRIPARIKKNKHNFCSRKCQGKYQSENWLKENNPSAKGQLVKCAICDKEKFVSPFDLKSKQNHFCSTKCMHKWQTEHWKGKNSPTYKERVHVKCEICAKDLYKLESQIKNIKHVCCSRECSNKLKSKLQTGTGNPNYGNKHSDETKQFLRKLTISQYKNGIFNKEDTLPERLVENYLLFNNIVYTKQYTYKLGIADFWLPETNSIIEVYGDYWHNLPNYKIRDKKKNEYLYDNDYDLHVLWEHEIKQDVERCMNWI